MRRSLTLAQTPLVTSRILQTQARTSAYDLPPATKDRKTLRTVLAIGGAAVLGTGTFLFVRRRRRVTYAAPAAV